MNNEEYKYYFNQWLLEDNITNTVTTESYSFVDKIIDIIKKIISYIKNFHPIKRSVINKLLEELKTKNTLGDFKIFDNLIKSTLSGLLYICDYNLRNLIKLEESMFELYNKFGSNPNPTVIKNNIFLKFEINSNLNNYIFNKIKEYCKDNELVYSRHNIITVNSRANVINITVIIYDLNSNSYVESFRYQVSEKEMKGIKYSELNTKRIAEELLKSHLSSLDKFRWVTETLNSKLKENLMSADKSVVNISESIINMVNNLNNKFYIIATTFAKDCLKEKNNIS